jgi:hypothetical protein
MRAADGALAPTPYSLLPIPLFLRLADQPARRKRYGDADKGHVNAKLEK